jgi:hypothetical protein
MRLVVPADLIMPMLLTLDCFPVYAFHVLEARDPTGQSIDKPWRPERMPPLMLRQLSRLEMGGDGGLQVVGQDIIRATDLFDGANQMSRKRRGRLVDIESLDLDA